MGRYTQIWFFCDVVGCETKTEMLVPIVEGPPALQVIRDQLPQGWGRVKAPIFELAVNHPADTFCPGHSRKEDASSEDNAPKIKWRCNRCKAAVIAPVQGPASGLYAASACARCGGTVAEVGS